MTKRFLFYAALVLSLALSPLAAHATADIAGDMERGVWATNPRYMTFGSYNGNTLVWRVLEVKDKDNDFKGAKTAFLLLDDLLRDSSDKVEIVIYDYSSNSFPDSVMKRWLNDENNGFIVGLENYKADVLDTTYGPDNRPRRWSGGAASGKSKVFLLSVGEANNVNYFANEADRAVDNKTWWLRSPGFENSITALVLSDGGVARNGNYTSSIYGIRPAIKIDLSSSSSFINIPVSYMLIVKADDGSAPIMGAKISLVPSTESAQSATIYSNSVGVARFANVLPGEYTVKISKPGYIAKSEDIIITSSATPAISIVANPTAMPDKVRFGKYDETFIEWSVLDIVNGKALLFAGALFQSQFDMQGSTIWANSSLRSQLNGNKEGDFLHESNFSTEEAAAIDAKASATGDAVFILSCNEVYSYLTDANMRFYDDKEWLTRSALNEEDVEVISPGGDYGGGIQAYTRYLLGWVRPAMWIDLSRVTYDAGTNTLLPIEK
ncbi:MAG: carboxypeptidase-like regulatory domain-containing protein [Synergistaceae bacterium]|nr:carboxypeptidase-like regulatory domain-containing protein [Synergistaceae bacterium]